MKPRSYWLDYWDRRLGPHRHFTTSDVAQFCEVDVRTVQRWIADGKLAALAGTNHTTHHARVFREDLLEFLVGRSMSL